MNKTTRYILKHLTSSILVTGAIILMILNIEGWGWLLLIAILLH